MIDRLSTCSRQRFDLTSVLLIARKGQNLGLERILWMTMFTLISLSQKDISHE
jgi:hypothetical protein